MKLKFDVDHKNHPDPFVLDDNGKYYLYPSTAFGDEGVRVYSADDPIRGEWKYEGISAKFEGAANYWAPSVVKYEGKYYMYVSFERGESHQFMHVAESESPLGPFKNEKMLYKEFSIDSHAVVTDAGLFLFYAKNKYKPDYEGERIGTRIFVDRMIDPYTPARQPVEKVVPDFDEEIFTPQYPLYQDTTDRFTLLGDRCRQDLPIHRDLCRLHHLVQCLCKGEIEHKCTFHHPYTGDRDGGDTYCPDGIYGQEYLSLRV